MYGLPCQEGPNVFGHAEVIAEGAGLAIVQMDVTYNVDRDYLLVPPAQDAFDLKMSTRYWGRNKSHVEIETCTRLVFLLAPCYPLYLLVSLNGVYILYST